MNDCACIKDRTRALLQALRGDQILRFAQNDRSGRQNDRSGRQDDQSGRQDDGSGRSFQNHGNLVTILQETQKLFGYIPKEAVEEIAHGLDLSASSVYSVVTFYSQFRLHPEGKHQVKVCLGTACHMKGGKVVLESWEREMGLRSGRTTPDMEYSLKTVACVGCCALAPVTVVDEEVIGRVTPIRVKGVLLSHKIKREGGLGSK